MTPENTTILIATSVASFVAAFIATRRVNKSHDRREPTPVDRGGIPNTTPILIKPNRR